MGWIPTKRIRQLAAVWQSLRRDRPPGYVRREGELQFEIRCLEERRVLNGAPVAAHGQGHGGQDAFGSVPGQSIPGSHAALLTPAAAPAAAQTPVPVKTAGAGHPNVSPASAAPASPSTNLPGTEGHVPFNLGSGALQPAAKSSSVSPADNGLLLVDTTPAQTFAAVEGSNTGQVVLTTFTDANPFAVASDFTASVNWDGTTEGPGTVTIQQVGNSEIGFTWEVLGSATYAEAGTYHVTVQVQDVGGNTLTSQRTSFAVADAPLTDTTPVQTYNAVEGSSTGQVILATFTDADPYSVATDYAAAINWGGVTEGASGVVVQEISTSATGSTWEVLGTATYAEAGTYHVTVSVNDLGGNRFTSQQTSFAVADAPLADATPVQSYNAVEGSSSGQVVLATFTDADPYAVATDYAAAVNWGGTIEGTASVVIQEVSASPTGSTWEVLGTATYAEAGTYHVTLELNDFGGSTFVSQQTSFAVADAALTDTTPTQTLTAIEGSSTGQVVLATFTDADPYAVATDYTPIVNWGGAIEGNPSLIVQEVSTSANGSTWELLGTATYAEAGAYRVTVQINDFGGSTFTSQQTSFAVADAALADTTPLQTLNAVEGSSSGQVVLATFTDADPYAVATDYTPTVAWGGVIEGTPSVIVQEVSSSATGSTWEVLGAATYAEAGTYRVTVQISDFGGNTFTSQQTSFAVADAALANTTPTQTYDAVEGASTGQVVLATFTDADPYAVATDYATAVDWGGPIRGTGSVMIQELSTSATGSTWEVLGTASYVEEGTYQVTVQINDFGGSTLSINNSSFSVSDPAVVITPVTLTIPLGASSGVQTVATFTDPGGPEDLSNYSATIQWGDGTAAVPGTIVFDAATGVFSVQGSHVYGYDTTYPITVTVAHEQAPNATSLSTAVVTDVPPTLSTMPSYSVAGQGSVLTLTNIHFSDPAFPVLSNSPTFTYSINWQDGSPIQTGAAPVTQYGSPGVPTTGAFNLSHTYQLGGSYSATLTIYDHDHELATEQITIMVPVVPPAVTPVSFSELNDLSQTSGMGTVYDPGTNPITVTVHWGDGTSTTLILPGGVVDTFDVQHQFTGPPNPNDPAAPISVTVAVINQVSVFGHVEPGEPIVQTQSVQVPGTGVVFVTFFPEPKAPPLALGQTVLTERSSFTANQPLVVNNANELTRVRAEETGVAEDRVVLRLVSADGVDANDVVLPGKVLDDLPGYLKRLPDGHYRVYYIQGDTHRERLIIDVNVRGGRPVDADEDSGGTQDRPTNAQFPLPRPITEEQTGQETANNALPAGDSNSPSAAMQRGIAAAPPDEPVSLSAGSGFLTTALLVAHARRKVTSCESPLSGGAASRSRVPRLSKTARLIERVRKAYRPK